MKKSTKIRKLAEEIACCIFANNLNIDETEEYLTNILCEVFCDSVEDYPKNKTCDHKVPLSKECSECSK